MKLGDRIATSQLVEHLLRLDEAGFAREWTWPALVRKPDRQEPVEERAASYHTEASLSVAASELAMRRSHATGKGLGRVEPDAGELRLDDVIPLRKRDDSTTFSDRVGIGRASNMDVVIELPRISKYHAYVVAEGGEVSLCDARSTFGTFVEGERLEPLVPRVVESGAWVELGPYGFRLYDAEGLRAYLAVLARRRSVDP